MTLKELIKNSSLSRPEAEMLIAFILKKQREFVIVHQEHKINKSKQENFLLAEKKRLNHWPMAYLTGNKEFYGLNFKVNKNVLVPRPETETMIEFLLEHANNKTEAFNFIDVGTGSGAIIITFAKELKRLKPSLFKKSNFFGLDISKKALAVAKDNAKFNELGDKINFITSNLLDKVPSRNLKNKDLIIAANLPYLTPKQIKTEKSISQEPKLALDGGSDGLKYYRYLLKSLKKIEFKSLCLILEIDPNQTKGIKKIINYNWPGHKSLIIKDLRKKDRFALIKINQ